MLTSGSKGMFFCLQQVALLQTKWKESLSWKIRLDACFGEERLGAGSLVWIPVGRSCESAALHGLGVHRACNDAPELWEQVAPKT